MVAPKNWRRMRKESPSSRIANIHIQLLDVSPLSCGINFKICLQMLGGVFPFRRCDRGFLSISYERFLLL